MTSQRTSRDLPDERGSLPLDIDDVHILLQDNKKKLPHFVGVEHPSARSHKKKHGSQVEQEQIQKRTFTNWINAQLSKRSPPVTVVDLFNEFRDGSRLLDLLEVLSGQRMSREKGRGTFQHRTNIEKGLEFLKRKSIKLVNINVSDIMDGKPSIILGLVWTIIMHIHIEELASTLNFSSRQSSLESLASLDTRSTSSSARSSPVPPHGSPLHTRFRISAKKALLLWVREQCQKAGCTLNVKDFKVSWRSGVVFLAILHALRPNIVDLTRARTRTNRQNLEEAFHTAETELHIPRLLDPADVDVRDPDEKSIMTYVAQFLQYSKDASVSDEEMQVFHTFIVSFNEQRRPVMPLLTAMKRTPHLSAEQKALRRAWDALAEKLREYKTELDMSLPSPLDTVGRWLLRIEEVLSVEEGEPIDHARAAEEAREKLEILKVCLEEMPHHIKRFNMFQNTNEFGEALVPADKMEEMKRRFTNVRVTAKYHGIKLEYRERRHTVLDLLNQLNIKLRSWKRAYISQEAVRVLMQDWNETVNKQELTSLLDGALHRLKLIANKYTSKAALAGDSTEVNRQVADLEADVIATLEGVRMVRGTMGRVLAAWDSYSDIYTSMRAWLEQGPHAQRHGQSTEVTLSVMSEWSSRQAHLNEVANYLTEVTDPQTSRAISDELCKINLLWADFAKTAQFSLAEEPSAGPSSPQTVQCLIREATQLLKEPVEVVSGSLRTYTKRLQLMMKKIKDVDLEALLPSLDCSPETLSKLQQAIPEVLQTLCEAEQVCDELRVSVSGLDGRLAELLHWEMEARELYQLLKEETHRQKRGQDPRARVLISRGLQLEGQVVMEEQDLQMMVMTNQKTSPLQYLIASTMQDRVRTAVEKSQEAVGMLSSLGACRERSPVRDQPPSKIFVQYQETEEESQKPSFQPVSPSGAPGKPEPQPAVRAKVPEQSQILSEVSYKAVDLKTQQCSQPVPMIVVQEGNPSGINQEMSPKRTPECKDQFLLLPKCSHWPISKLIPNLQPQSQPQQWSSARPELPWGQSQIRPQGPAQHIVPSQQWRPISPERVSPVYPRAETQGPKGPHPQTQYQALPRPASPQHQWRPVRPEHQFQVSSQTMFHGAPQPVAPWNQPPSQALIRSQSPQQPQQSQQKWISSKTEAPSATLIQSQVAQAELQSQDLTKLQLPVQEPPQQQSVPRVKQPALAQAPPQAYTEAYIKAQALVRDRFEEAKHCLQEHIIEAISVFKDKRIMDEQASVKEETLRTLDPELLEEFLRAAEGMEAFCTPSELRDMEFFKQSVRTQWKACLSAEGSLAEAGQQLEALKELCDTLSPEDAHRLAQAQLRECERRLAAIQRQFSGDTDTPPSDTSLQTEQTKEPPNQKAPTVPPPPEKPKEVIVSEAVTPVSPQRLRTVEKREIVKQTSTEEDRYRSSRFALQAQLNRNEQCMLGDRTSESVTPTDLQKRLRELKSLWDETESLWKEYEALCMQCVQYNERAVEQDRMELTVRWREQRSQLQGSDNFTDLDESIQTEMDRLSRFDSEPSHLDLRDRSPLTQVVLNHRSSLDQLRQQVRKSDAAARALDRFLMSLRTVELDVSSVQSAPSNDAVVLQDSRSKLALIRKGVSSLKDKAPQLDQLLGGAQLEVTQDGSPVSCLDMVGVLVRRVEEADDQLMIRQNELQKEQQNQSLGLRRKTIQAELRKVLAAAEKQGLKDPTMPAVQHRMRALSDVELQLKSLRPEYQSIKKALSEVSSQKEHPHPANEELDFLWEETERAVSDRQEQCTVLMELLKKFQNCRSYLGNTLQRAEQTINEQASYMGKDNLQRLLAKVVGIKEDLNSLGPKMEEFRSVCRQLQSQLKKIPDCSETPFETEADALVDSWLDVSEKTDSYMDNLRVGLELWEKQLVLGGEVESWTSTKLIIFSESHPFSSETEVDSMKNEIQCQEDNLEHFHRKLLEIQELLQSKESPLELQVMETNLRKKIEQVKELFADCTEVFQELLTVKAHMIEKIDTYQSSVKNIRSSVDMISSEDRTELDAHLQDFCEQLLDQEEQAETLLKEINLMSSITGPQALEELTNHCKHLKDSIAETQELIRQKKDQGEKSFLQTIKEDFQSFEEWLQDEQLSVNECFENPERKQDIETSMQRLTSFLASKEGEQRLAQLKERFEQGGQAKLPAEAQALLSTWHQEQEGELATLRAHCQGRHKQLDDILHNLNSLHEEHNHLKDWLQQREQVPEQREKLRQIQEDFLKERMRGLRGDPLLRNCETLIDRYHSLGILLENQAQVQKTLDDQVETFQTNAEQIRAWIRNLKQRLEYLGTDTPMQEKHVNAQAVLNLSPEGDAKLVALKEEGDALCAHEILEDTRRQELIHTLGNIEDEWKRVLDMAEQLKHQAELQDTLCRELEDLQAQEESIQSWVREQLQMLRSLGKDLQPHEKLNKVQAVIDLGDQADSRLASLQRQGHYLCSYKELENERRSHIDQNQRAVEEEWRKVLQLAQELKNQVKHEETLYRELQTFCDQGEDTQSWIRHLRETLDSLLVTSSIQERLNGAEQEWMGVLMQTQELKNQSELEQSLSKDLHDLQEQAESTHSWLTEQHLKIKLLGEETQLQERMNGAQAILNSESEGDYKLANLRRKAEALCSREGLEEKRKQEFQLNLRSIEKEWKKVLASAQELKNQAELQDSLAREFQNVCSQEESIWTWVKNQKDCLDSLGKSTHGTQEQIEERLSKAQGILSLHSEGNSKIAALKQTVDHLFNREDLDEDARQSLVKKMKNVEEEWKTTLQQAQELHSLLKSVVERLVSCRCQKEQLQSHLDQVKQQTAALPRHFPWPGLGDRRHTLEQAKSLLDHTRALTPSLSAVRALGREMSQLTHDSSWIDPSWATTEECIPELIKDLTEFCVNLEEEIRRERVCAQLVEQHTVAQDWLREQVKGFGALPTERHGLQSSINTLKALLQTIDREKREMKELDNVKDSLMDLCTPGGCDALTLEVSHLHDLCVSSEKEMREWLAVCEARLSDIDLRLAGKAQILREQAESLLDELRAQDHSVGFLVDSQNISQLQENWHSFKTCERELESLEGKVCDLGQALQMVPPNEGPPSDVISIVDTVTQQYCSLRSKLLEKQNDCADSTVQCVRQALQNIQSWNQTHANPPCSSATSMQAAIDEGVRLCKSLQVVLSHKELLRECLGPDLAGKLERDGTKALNEADIHMNDLKQELKNVEENMKQEAQRLSLEARSIQLDSQVSAATPSTKESEQSEFVSSSSFITESFEMTDGSQQAKNDQKTEVQSEKLDVSTEEKIECEEALHVIEERNEWDTEVQSKRMNVSLTPEEKHEVVDNSDIIVEEETNKTPSDEKAHSTEAEPKPTPPVRRRNENKFDVQSNKVNISTTSEKTPEGTEVNTVTVEDEIKMTPSDDKAQSLEVETILTPPVRQQNEGETDLQSTTSEEKPGDTMHISEEERTKKTLVDKMQSIEAEPKPTPPVRRRNEGKTDVQLDKVDVIPTPPTRRRKEISSLIQEVSALKDHLENIQKTLDASKTSPVLWDGKRAQEIMNLNAELTSTHQQYLYLQQTSEALAQEFQFNAEISSIEQDLQHIKDQLNQMGEQLAASTPSSSNSTLSKIVKVMTDALAWAKQTESDVKGRQKKVPLLPEEVHRQIKDLKKLQSEMNSKQTQLKSLVEEVTELISDLDEADVPMVTSSLKVLENLSKSTAGKLAEAVRDMESGLQTREKMSEQIADVDSWVVGHLQREALRREDYQSLSVADLDRRLRQIEEILGEAEKQSAVTEALLMKSRDIASELSVTEKEKRREMLCVITELYHKMIDLDLKSQAHERYLSLSRCIDDVKEEIEAQIPRTKDESINKDERYRACQTLLIHISLVKLLCEETMDELQEITADLYPSQLSAEQTRLKQILESLETSEMAVNNNLQILEWDLLKHIHYPSEKRALQQFLKDTNEKLEKPCSIEPKEAVIEKQLRKCLVLRKNVESRIRVLEFLEKKVGARPPQDSKQLACLKDMVLEKCDQRMALVEEVAMLPGKLENLREWCSLHGCRANREDAVSAIWGQVARLQRCGSDLQTRSEQMEAEWSSVTRSVEQAVTVLEQVDAELPDSSRENLTGDELQELLLFWSQYQDRLDCEHRALSALELRAARVLGVPPHLEQAPPIELCQELQALQERYHSLKERSSQGLRAVRTEVEERERVQEQLEGVREWLESAVSLLAVLEHEPSKKQLQVKTAVEKSGPLHRLGAKISEIKAGLGSVQSWLEQKSLNFTEAESTQKRVWDELDGLHTLLTAVEVELQDLSEMHPDETRLLLDSLANTQQTHTRLTKQAEQRTAFLSKVRDWLQEHEEMVKGSQSWISEAQSWLTTPCTYTTARCLDSHVNALQMVLDDSAQMRRTLQGFGSVLTEMGSVFDEVDAIESEVKVMEKDVAKIKSTLTTKEDISQDSLKTTEERIDLMKRTVTEIQNCKDGLCLPDKAENTLLVFKKAEQLQKQLLELEQLALEYSIEVQETFMPPLCVTPLNAPPLIAPTLSVPPTITEEDTQESGQIQIVHVEEDILKKAGATLMTVEQSTLEQRLTWISDRSSQTVTETQDRDSADVVSSTEQILEQAEAADSKVEVDTSLASGTGVSEASSEADGTVESQSLPADMAAGEAGGSGGWLSGDGLLHACRERAEHLEVCLERAQVSLEGSRQQAQDAAMQHCIEQQLHNCQTILVEIEQRISSLPVCGLKEQEQHEAESLNTKLQLLKNRLVTVLLQLQERHGEDQVPVESQRPLQARLKRSNSVQEMLSSSKTKLFRQSSLQQQRGLSAELISLGAILTSHGSEVIKLLGLGSAISETSTCFDLLRQYVCDVQKTLADKQEQLQERLKHTTQLQAITGWKQEVEQSERNLAELKEEIESRDQPSSLTQQISTLEAVLESVWSDLEQRCGVVQWSLDEQKMSEKILKGLQMLLMIGGEKLACTSQQELENPAQIQTHLNTHTAFFLSLGAHLRRLQQLSVRMPDSASSGWETEVSEVERQVSSVLQQAQAVGTVLHSGLQDFDAFQVCTHWDENQSWLETVLQRLESQLPITPLQDQTEEQLSENISVYQGFMKELEVKSALKASVISSGSFILLLNEREQNIETQKISRTTSAPRTSTPSRNTTTSEDLQPSETSNRTSVVLDNNPEDSSSVDVTLPSQTNVSSIQNIFSEENLSTTEESDGKITNESVIFEEPTSSVFDLSVKQEMVLSPVLLTLQSQLSQVEQDWVEIQKHIPVVQQELHQSVVESLSPEELLADMCGWITGAESRLQAAERESHNTCTVAAFTHLLRTYQVMKREIACQQMSVDFINQCELKQASFDSHTSRYKHTAFAENLGHVNLRWKTLQDHLNTLIQHAEDEVRMCAERDNKLQILQRWVKGQKQWMQLAERPISRSFAERSLKDCEELGEKLKSKFSELAELRKRRLTTDEEGRDKDFLSKAHNLSQSLTDLSQQSIVLGDTLKELCKVWSQFESGRSQAVLNTMRICQSLEYCHAPLPSLSALQNKIDKIQVLIAETKEIDSQWGDLTKITTILIGGISPDSAQVLWEHLEKEKARWLEVKEKVTYTLQRSHSLLKVWQRYSDVRRSCSEQLQHLKEQLNTHTKTPADNKQLTHSIAELKTVLQKCSETLQTDLNEVLEVSKDLIEQMDDEDAIFIRSECRLLTRGYLQLEQTLKGRIEHMKEDLEQFQEFERLFQSLEAQLQQWESNQRIDRKLTDISQSGLMEVSSLSPDLDLMNTLSYRLTLGDPVTQRLQHLNRKWAQASAHAQEKCSELQAASLQQQSFEQRCESWLAFLQRMEDSLDVEIASTYPGLKEQQRTHQCFQAELSLGHQILHSVISESLILLQKGDVEDRSDFLLKLAQLREHWQGAVQRAAQRRALVEGLIQHWQLYTHTMQKLRKLLTLTHTLLSPAGPTHCSVLQLRLLLEDLKVTR
ncbi:hypothetical protein cypCar_00022230 [Cyprinus carpio]|nr:hypothetical protein cypCar_00022230 [Cyprinus carpio]